MQYDMARSPSIQAEQGNPVGGKESWTCLCLSFCLLYKIFIHSDMKQFSLKYTYRSSFRLIPHKITMLIIVCFYIFLFSRKIFGKCVGSHTFTLIDHNACKTYSPFWTCHWHSLLESASIVEQFIKSEPAIECPLDWIYEPSSTWKAGECSSL